VGLLYTTTSNTGFITGLSVILVPFLALFLLQHPISRYTWLSAILAAIGLYLLAFAGSAFALNRGDFLVFLCAIAFALHVAYTAMYAPKYTALLLATLQMTVVGLLSLGSSLLFEDIGPIHQLSDKLLQPEVLWALLVSIGPTSALAFWIQTVSEIHFPFSGSYYFCNGARFCSNYWSAIWRRSTRYSRHDRVLMYLYRHDYGRIESSPSTLQSM